MSGGFGAIYNDFDPDLLEPDNDWMFLDKWLARLPHANKVSLEFSFCGERSAHERPEVEQRMRQSLVTFLQGFSRACVEAKHVLLEIKYWPSITRTAIPKTLQPLMLLSKECTLQLIGMTREEEASFWRFETEG